MQKGGSGNSTWNGADRRRREQRTGKDRRQDVRWEPGKANRRDRQFSADRRRGNVWGR